MTRENILIRSDGHRIVDHGNIVHKEADHNETDKAGDESPDQTGEQCRHPCHRPMSIFVEVLAESVKRFRNGSGLFARIDKVQKLGRK